MASDSHTPTIAEKVLENKVNEEAKLMEKESVSSDVVIDKLTSDSNPVFIKEEEIDRNVAGESEKESPAVVKAEESTEKHENGENVAEQVELKEPILVKTGVEAGDAEKPEEKPKVESVVDVSESTDEAEGKQMEPVDIQSVREVSVETTEDKLKDSEFLGFDTKLEASEKVETQPDEPKQLEPEVVVVKAEETPETTEQAHVEGKLEDRIVETKDFDINSKDEKTSELESVLCPEEIVPINQESDTNSKKEIERDSSSPVDVTEKATTEEKLVVDEPSKDEITIESESALCPEKVLPTNQDSDANFKKEIEGDASYPVDVIEKATTEEKHVVGEPSKNETTSESASALCPEKVLPKNQDSETELKKETEEVASSPAVVIEKAIAEEKHVVEEPSKDETTSALCPEKVVPTNQNSDTEPKKETQENDSSPVDVIEKAITEEKRVVEEPSKDEQENVSEAKDIVTKLATEGENIKKDTEPPAADDKNEETLKESGEKETTASKQEESITEKATEEVVERTPVVKESDEQKQEQPEITTKEVSVKPKSNSIMSKVKQSLVKAKKAIIGKSPSSKTISTEETKGEIQVK